MDAVFALVFLLGSLLFLGLGFLPLWLSTRRNWPESHHSVAASAFLLTAITWLVFVMEASVGVTPSDKLSTSPVFALLAAVVFVILLGMRAWDTTPPRKAEGRTT